MTHYDDGRIIQEYNNKNKIYFDFHYKYIFIK